MLVYVDKLRSNEISLEKKLERERKRTQRLALVLSQNCYWFVILTLVSDGLKLTLCECSVYRYTVK